MEFIQCPECGSTDIQRIGLYEYQCESCGDVFDASEVKGKNDDWFPEEKA